MADLSDVTTALVAMMTAALYPNGSGQPSVTGQPYKIGGGWPIPDELDLDLQGLILAGSPATPMDNGIGPITTVTVYPQPNMERVTTRYLADWAVSVAPAATLTASAVGNVVTIGGTVTAGNYVTIVANNQGFSYIALASDTLATIAAILAAQINASMTATSSGASITLPAKMSGLILVNAAAPNAIIKEIRRQQRSYQIVIWAPSNAARIATANILDPLLAGTDFIALPDTTQAWVTYRATMDSDDHSKVDLYRRDLCYWVEYAMTQTSIGYPITVVTTSVGALNGAGGDVAISTQTPVIAPANVVGGGALQTVPLT